MNITEKSEKLQDKIRKYELFLEEKLKNDLKKVEETLRLKNSLYQEWEEVEIVSKTIQSFREKDEDMYLKLNIDEYILAQAEIHKFDTVFVDIGLGHVLEMEPEEAIKYSHIRQRALKSEVQHFRKLAVEIKVHIKLVLLALQELQTLKIS